MRELVLELSPPKPLSSVSSAEGPPPEVAVERGTGERQRDNEKEGTEVERERERRVMREKQNRTKIWWQDSVERLGTLSLSNWEDRCIGPCSIPVRCCP